MNRICLITCNYTYKNYFKRQFFKYKLKIMPRPSVFAIFDKIYNKRYFINK